MSLVLRALPLCGALGGAAVPEARAQSAGCNPLTADIPPQPLEQALTAFARQTGCSLVYVSGVLRHQRSSAAPSGLTADAALTRLLAGTGLRFEHLTAHGIRILAVAPHSPVTPAAEVPEIIVTATRREESLEDVPMTVQTLSGEQARQLGVTTFNDLLGHAASVTYSGNGPATGNIYIRGLGAAGTGNQQQATVGSFPNVALYLDDQAMQFPARNNDIYMVDLERLEILEGPQGTLFGGGAQAGAVRYITRKPLLDATSGEVNAGYGTTAGGANDSALSAVLNLALIADRVALRAAIFSERQGGYISNVPSTISYVPGTPDAATGASANNSHLVASDTNPVTYQGLRLSLLWQIDENWSALLQQNYQSMDAEGYFYAYPFDSNGTALGPYQIAAFAPAYSRDRYESTAWTLTGRIGSLSAIYTGSFLDRHVDSQQDYSNYLRSATSSYYSCIGPGAKYFNAATFPSLAAKPLTCYPPVANWHDTIDNQHQSHELRISTDPQRRLRGLFGAFWEKFVVFDQMDFNYLTIPQCDPANLAAALAGGPACLSAVGPLPGAFANAPGLREDMNTAFGNDDQRGYRQLAFFGSVDFDLIDKVLTLTAGTRRYHYDEFEYGSLFYSASTDPLILDHPNGACTAASDCAIPINLAQSEGGSVSRASLAWHITPDAMAYYTYSQGFRPSSFNRTLSAPGQAPILLPRAPYCGAASTDPRCLPGGSLFGFDTSQYLVPESYKSDTLINNELGIKSEWLEHRLVLNVSAYQMHWNDVQWLIADFANLGTLGFVANGPSYTIRGAELQLRARATEGLTLEAAGSWNSSSQTSAPCLVSAGVTPLTLHNPTPAGACITVINGHPYQSPWGALGSSLPYAPALQFNLRARYQWSVDAYRPFVQLSAGHVGSMSSAPADYPDGNSPAENPPTTSLLRYPIPGYTSYGGALGVARDNWTVQLTGSNLTDVYGPTNVSSAPFIKAVIPLRPRVLLARFAYSF